MADEQELLQRATMLKQESEEIEKQLQFVNEQIQNLESFSENLKVLEENKEREILSNIGRGVFIKTERNVREKLFVEVGAGVIVRKTPEEARRIILDQVKKFNEVKMRLTMQLEGYAKQFGMMLREARGLSEQK